MSDRKRRDWTFTYAFIFWVVSIFWSGFIVWQAFHVEEQQRQSECQLVNGTWSADRGMCFVPNTTLNGLNP